MKLSLREIFSNVGRVGLGDWWAFNIQVKLRELAKVMFVELVDLGIRAVVVMVL